MENIFNNLVDYVKKNPVPLGLIGAGVAGAAFIGSQSQPSQTNDMGVLVNKTQPNKVVPPINPNTDNPQVGMVVAQPLDDNIQVGNRSINLEPMNADDLRRQIQYQERRINSDLITLEEMRRQYEEEKK